MDNSFCCIVHGFEGVWRDAVEVGCFPLLQFVDGVFDFLEGDWGVDVGKAWYLSDEFKDELIDWSVVVEDFVEVIEAIFVVMGKPDESVWQFPLAMDEWNKLVIGPRQTGLGLIIDTNRLTVEITIKYLTEVHNLLDSTWHPNHCCFKVSEAQKLTGKLARLAEGANWVFHLLSHLYSSIAYVLAENKQLLESLQEFCNIVMAIRTGAFFTSCKDLARHMSFAMKQAARLTHHASYEYNINRTMCAKIDFFHDKLKPNSGIEWETPIAHLIP